MTQPEQRVLDDLRALAAGFTVTERDVDRAQDRLHARLAGPPPRSRRTMLVALAAAAVAVVLAVLGGVLVLDRVLGQTPPPPAGEEREPVAPTADQLVGVWVRDIWLDAAEPWMSAAARPTFVIRFGSDGMFALDEPGDFDGRPYAKGAYEVDGTDIIFSDTGGAGRTGVGGYPGCVPGESWVWQADLVQDGQLEVAVTEPPFDDCLARFEGFEWTLVRVSPASSLGAEIGAGPPAAETEPITQADLKQGLWLRVGSGQLLYPENGTYLLDDDGELGAGPDDVGTLEVVGDGTIVFTSGADSADCVEGNTMVWEGVGFDVGTISLHRVVVSSDTCANRGELDGTWISLW